MGSFSTGSRTQIEDLFSVLRIQQIDTTLSGSILHGNPAVGKSRQVGNGAWRQQAYCIAIFGMGFGCNTRLRHQLQIIFTGVMKSADTQPHRGLLIIGIDDLFPLRGVGLLDTFQKPAWMQIAAVIIGGALQQFFLLSLELA
ncbi:hypothetical protein D3C76_1380810 [compost metagenome]